MIKNTRERFTKVITLPDIHYPENIDLRAILQFIKDEKPDEIIYLGDIINADGISKFWTGDEEEGVHHTTQELLDFARDVHAKIRQVAPKAKITLTGGNHMKQRVDRAVLRKPCRASLLDIQAALPDVNILEYNELYKVGDLYYTHGIYHNDAHAKKHAVEVMKNVVYGHTHTVQEYTKKSMAEEGHVMAKSIGCLCNVNPHYGRHKPNAWRHAIHIAYVAKDGSFHEQTIPINDEKFIFNSKMYK